MTVTPTAWTDVLRLYHVNGEDSPEGSASWYGIADLVCRRRMRNAYQLFQQAVGREIDGTVGGLAIVRQVAERHGGQAWVYRARTAARNALSRSKR